VSAFSKGKCDHSEGPKHDCDYVDWRDSLVPLAEAVANAALGAAPVDKASTARWEKRWTHRFHAEMARLTQDPFHVLRAPAGRLAS
jgi:hypothetical protein